MEENKDLENENKDTSEEYGVIEYIDEETGETVRLTKEEQEQFIKDVQEWADKFWSRDLGEDY